MRSPVPVEEWGKDHWSMLAYAECRAVDGGGQLDPRHMRVNPARHPGLALPQHVARTWTSYPYSTRLAGGREEPEHDDEDCLKDLEALRLLKFEGTGIHPAVKMTARGSEVAAALRKHKASGGRFADFRWAP